LHQRKSFPTKTKRNWGNKHRTIVVDYRNGKLIREIEKEARGKITKPSFTSLRQDIIETE
jgi:hypothetical protein